MNAGAFGGVVGAFVGANLLIISLWMCMSCVVRSRDLLGYILRAQWRVLWYFSTCKVLVGSAVAAIVYYITTSMWEFW